MPRKNLLNLCILIIPACIDLPDQPEGNAPEDASTDWGLEAGPRRPAEGEPYVGPECESAAGSGASSAADLPDGGGGPLGEGGKADSGAGNTPARPSAAGDLVITEIMSNPASLRDDQGEWFELLNPSSERKFDLNGCLIFDGGEEGRAIAAPLVLAPGSFAVIARNANASVEADLVLSFSLSNDSDEIALRCDGVEIDRVVYGPGFPLASGVSMSLDPAQSDARNNDQASAWCLAFSPYATDLGTPGSQNPSCTVDAEEDAGSAF